MHGEELLREEAAHGEKAHGRLPPRWRRLLSAVQVVRDSDLALLLERRQNQLLWRSQALRLEGALDGDGAAVVVVVEPAGALPDVDALLDLSRDWIPLYSSFDNCTLKP